MSKKKTQPKPLTISFNEGKQRVSEMIDDIFDELVGDNITTLQEAKSLKYDGDRVKLLTESLQLYLKEYDELQSDLEKCYGLGDIIELNNKYGVFGGCEESLVGAFLGQVLIVVE